MALDFYTSTNRCPVCGGWARAGDSGETCVGGVLEGDRALAFCSVLNHAPATHVPGTLSRSGRTWAYRLAEPYDFEPEPKRKARRRGADREPGAYARPCDVPDSWREVAHYWYANVLGSGVRLNLFRVVRFESPDGTPDADGRTKTFRPWNIGRQRWGLRPGERIPYRLPELLEAGREGAHRVWIVEGEKDADRGAAEYPGEVFTCNPGGAAQWKPDYGFARYFEAVPEVRVIADRDDAGTRWARDVAADLGADRCVFLRAAVPKPGADLSDHLDARLGLDDLEEFNPAA